VPPRNPHVPATSWWNDRPVDELTPNEARRWRAWKTATESIRARIADDLRSGTGLADTDHSILTWVVEVGGGEMAGHVLEQALGFSRSHLLHRIDAMASRGWVIRSDESRSGRVWVRATERGRAVLDSARPVHAAAVRRHFLDRTGDVLPGSSPADQADRSARPDLGDG
jgi:DNA-binding MarR family transcriptional regulator